LNAPNVFCITVIVITYYYSISIRMAILLIHSVTASYSSKGQCGQVPVRYSERCNLSLFLSG